jgi:hypothetical protein
VAKVDGQIALQLGRMKSDRALPPLRPKPGPKRRVNSPGFDVRTALYHVVGLDLTEIEGVSELTALTQGFQRVRFMLCRSLAAFL